MGRRAVAARVTHVLLVLPVLGCIALLNLRAHRPGDVDTAIAQLRFIQHALSEDAADRMQRIFPEGHVFTRALYGLASAQVARALPSTDVRRTQLLEEARRAVQEVRSPKARSTFHARLEPPYRIGAPLAPNGIP
jgi:hypothetical protein